MLTYAESQGGKGRQDVLSWLVFRAEAQRQQQEAKNAGSSTTTEIVQEQRTSLKFGFGSKPVASKVETFILTSIEYDLISVVAPPTILTKIKKPKLSYVV